MAINKVIYGNNTLIDITDTTATASDVASGKVFYGADGSRITGTASSGSEAISVVDTQDSAGGTIRTITAVDISDTTAVASDVASGKVFYTADGTQTTGTASGGGSSTAADFLVALCENSSDLRNYTELPVNPTSFGQYEFYNKTNLALTSLPDSLTSIGDYSFYGCTRLALSSLPSNVTSINTYAFNGCTQITLTSLPSGITSISTAAFKSCSLLALTSLPSGVTSIGSGAFQACIRLALTSLPNSVTTIGSHAFNSCSALAITAIPDGVTTIDSYSFNACTSLTELTIPASVTTINTRAFGNNTGMTAYHMLGTTPPTLAVANAFYNIPSGCKIYVPTGSLSAYQTASNWSTYADYMEEE